MGFMTESGLTAGQVAAYIFCVHREPETKEDVLEHLEICAYCRLRADKYKAGEVNSKNEKGWWSGDE